MKVISVLAQKGGTGKTTLALHWAVAAGSGGARVAVLDLDPQGSAASWGRRRAADTPQLLQATPDKLPAAVAAARAAGFEWLFIDTMPHVERPAADAARAGDLVVIPCGPSVLDIEAIGATVVVAQGVGRSPVIVINQGRPGSQVQAKAAQVLAGYGVPVCPTAIMRRAVLADAFNDGRAVLEVEPEGKAAAEILETWEWICTQLGRNHA
jgi:chromosome partitioning protein